MHVVFIPVAGVLLLLTSVAKSATDAQAEPGVAEGYLDWQVAKQATTLTDESVLSEYLAQTHSEDATDATLQVSFFPRFSCSPIVSVLLPESLQLNNASETQLSLQVDQSNVAFPVLFDIEDNSMRLTFKEGGAGQISLRELFDVGSLAILEAVMPSPEPLPAIPTTESVPGLATGPIPVLSLSFSLLGSRMTVLTAERNCLAHEPIPYSL